MNFDLRKRTILLTIAGSRAYGTSTPESDLDLKGVAVPPVSHMLGFLHPFEQADKAEHMRGFADLLTDEERAVGKAEGVIEGVIYDIRKFCKLASDANPNILDALFCRDEDVRFADANGRLLRSIRHKFLSKKALYTFTGYAAAQLKRIETHRRWLLHPPCDEPRRVDFDLPAVPEIPMSQMNAALGEVRRKMDSWSIDFGGMDEAGKIFIQDQISRHLAEIQISQDAQWRAAATLLNYDDNFILLLQKERLYEQAHGDWEKFEQWKRGRNPARAEIERKYGYDTKHASHLVRLMRGCREILVDGTYSVYRPDASELREIRNGAWTYERLIDWAQQEEVDLKALALKSPLPRSPDREAINDICIDIVQGMPT